MNLKYCFILLLALCGLTHYSMASEKTISIAAPYITSLIEKDQSGIYQVIVNEALKNTQIDTKQSFFPYKRALTIFKEGKVDCVYSFTKVLQTELGEDKVIASFPLGAFAYYMFTPKGTSPITSSDQLLGLKVGAVIGHDSYYKHTLNKDTQLQMVSSDTQNIQMLASNRIDALIGALPDLTPYVEQLSYSSAHPLVTSYDRITCHNTPDNQRFIDQLSTALRALKDNGSYKQISGKLYLDFNESSL